MLLFTFTTLDFETRYIKIHFCRDDVTFHNLFFSVTSSRSRKCDYRIAPVVLQGKEKKPGKIGPLFPRHRGLADQLGEGRVPPERDQKTAGPLQTAEVPPVSRRDLPHAREVRVHAAPLVPDLLRNDLQLHEVLEEDHVVGRREDFGVFFEGRVEAGEAVLEGGAETGLAHRQLFLRRRVRAET